MKKIIIVFIFLLLLGAAAFFFGWMNIWVPSDSYAVMTSRSSGYDETVIGPGSGFVWRWQHLIPANVTLHIFTLTDHTAALTAKGTLPSADVYSKAVPYAPDFSYDIDLAVSYRLRPTALLGLVKSGTLTPQTLNTFYEGKKDEITSAVIAALFSLAAEDDAALLGDPTALEKRLLELLRGMDETIMLTRLSPRGIMRLPDPAVYRRARAAYEALAEQQRRLELAKMLRADALFGREDMAFDRSVARLERYGELFEKHPVLLKYLFITRNPAAAGSMIPEVKDLFDVKGSSDQ